MCEYFYGVVKLLRHVWYCVNDNVVLQSLSLLISLSKLSLSSSPQQYLLADLFLFHLSC